MSTETIQVPDIAVRKIGELTLMLTVAQQRIGELEALLADSAEPPADAETNQAAPLSPL